MNAVSPMVFYDWNELSEVEKHRALLRPVEKKSQSVAATVADLIKEVRQKGDLAVRLYTEKWDGARLDDFRVSSDEWRRAEVSLKLDQAIDLAIGNIRRFHEAQRPVNLRLETHPGVRCERVYVPLTSVGLYVPGGSAPLLSTLMMLAIPALAAGCDDIQVVTPPRRDGSIDPSILLVARKLGIRNLYKCGGAQAIAALAYGTETIPRVAKIFGPGNVWVSEAKLQVSTDPQGAAIDMPAGPSEVLVIADSAANAAFVASDLLSQAEHDVLSQVILITTSRAFAESVQTELFAQLQKLSRREIAAQALKQSRILWVEELETAFEIANCYAPEHLILHIDGPRDWVSQVRTAGSVFVGPWTPESAGDYASGTNHVLPTYGFARSMGGLSTLSFMRSMTIQELTPQGLINIGPAIETLAEAEGLGAHKEAVRVRRAALDLASVRT